MNNSIDDYTEQRECFYKNEHFSARDNGAVMRHQRDGMRKRKLDDVWSFGTQNSATGYLDFCGERVHRIVATAFHGPAPSEQHVVDHIDTNRQNNRPDNLRWLTKLENILTNEITRKKVELICGSVEAFLENPSLLYGYETEDKNFSWMKSVSQEEAKNCLENWSHWAKTAKPNPNFKKNENRIGEWIYNKPVEKDNSFMNRIPDARGGYKTIQTPITFDELDDEVMEEERKGDDMWFESLTPSAKQSWRTKTEFPCCPVEVTEEGLEQYDKNLMFDHPFSINSYDTYYVIESKLVKEKQQLVILSTNHKEEHYLGTYSLALVVIDQGKFAHISLRRYGDGKLAKHFYRLLIGEEKWNDDDMIMWDT